MRILWIPHTGWAIPQRAHHFCRELARRHEVHVTDWVADFTSPAAYLSRRYLRNFLYRRSRDGEIVVHGIPRISPALFFPALRRLNAALFARHLRRIVAGERIDAVVGTFVAPPVEAPRLVFDVFDDNVGLWRAHGRMQGYAAEIAATEAAYLERADAVVVVSRVLADRLRAAGCQKPLTLIPNGVRLSDFSGAGSDAGQALRRELGLRGPVIGLIGNHDRWDELARVLDVARIHAALPATFLIVGRGAAVQRAQHEAARAGLSNVRFAGFVPPERVAPYFAAVDVGLCPYTKSAGADAQCPMRLLAYSAAGSAVVCTELEEVKRMRLPNVVLVGDRPEQLAAGVVEALRLPRQRPAEMQHYDIEALARRYEQVLAGAAGPADAWEQPSPAGSRERAAS
ncbi:MAG: glycosyltransferase [Chloroflexota bacterium]